MSGPVLEHCLLLAEGGGHDTGVSDAGITLSADAVALDDIVPDILDILDTLFADSHTVCGDDDLSRLFLNFLSVKLTPISIAEDDDIVDEEEEHIILVAEDLVAEDGDDEDNTCLSSSCPKKSSCCRVSGG